MNLFRPLAEFQLDVLKEVGNIGAGHAATALSKLLDKPVDMLVPQVRIKEFEEIADTVGGSEQIVIAIFLRVEGEAPGNLFIILSLNSAKRLLKKNMAGIDVEEEGRYSEMELSALNEIGNILAGSYLSSLADFTELPMFPSVPSLAIDMAGAILSSGLMQLGQMGDHALLIDTTFVEDQAEVEGHFILIPDPARMKKFFLGLWESNHHDGRAVY